MTQTGSKNQKLFFMAISVVAAAVLTLIFILLTAGLMLSAGLGGRGISIALIMINILPMFIASFFLGKKVEEKRYLWGMAAAVLFFCLYMAIALLFQGNQDVPLGGYVKTFLITLFSGMLGGMLS